MSASSRLAGFYRLSCAQRLKVLEGFAAEARRSGTVVDLSALAEPVPVELLDRFVENVIGPFALPLGVAVNFLVDGRDLLVPMAVEESSVVAAASNIARIVRPTGGFRSEVLGRESIGQIQLLGLADLPAAAAAIEACRAQLLQAGDALLPELVGLGGGMRGLRCRLFDAEETLGEGPVLVLHLHLDCRDAMGANMVNTVCEGLAPEIERITGGRAGLRIVSNLADRRLIRLSCAVRAEDLAVGAVPGEEVARRVESASRFAHYDPYRAATHNKGTLNGIDPVVIATGNDWRAVEAGCHAFAARDGRYRSLTRWSVGDDGLLHGQLDFPNQLGTVGGVTRLHPVARVALQLLDVSSADQLGAVVAAVGLAQNLGAIRALVTEGIQRGHMRLHERKRRDGAPVERGG